MGHRVSVAVAGAVAGARVSGPLADYAAGFAEFLTGQGYVAGSVRLQVCSSWRSSAAGWAPRVLVLAG